jgi:hypothetical protein
MVQASRVKIPLKCSCGVFASFQLLAGVPCLKGHGQQFPPAPRRGLHARVGLSLAGDRPR